MIENQFQKIARLRKEVDELSDMQQSLKELRIASRAWNIGFACGLSSALIGFMIGCALYFLQ